MTACKAKTQNLRLMAPIKKVQAEVIQKSKRNMARCLENERAAAAKVKRDEERGDCRAGKIKWLSLLGYLIDVHTR